MRSFEEHVFQRTPLVAASAVYLAGKLTNKYINFILAELVSPYLSKIDLGRKVGWIADSALKTLAYFQVFLRKRTITHL